MPYIFFKISFSSLNVIAIQDDITAKTVPIWLHHTVYTCCLPPLCNNELEENILFSSKYLGLGSVP